MNNDEITITLTAREQAIVEMALIDTRLMAIKAKQSDSKTRVLNTVNTLERKLKDATR